MRKKEKGNNTLTWIAVIWIAVVGVLALLAASDVKADYELVIFDKTDPNVMLGYKRYISIYNCRDERQWLFTLLHRTEAKPVWIVCTPLEGTTSAP